MREAHLELPSQPESAAAARAFVGFKMRSWGFQSEDVILVASELVANAIQHARTPISVSLGLEDHLVTVKVADASPDQPTIRRSLELQRGGRGLPIVENLSTSWGIEELPHGKCVWAVVGVSLEEPALSLFRGRLKKDYRRSLKRACGLICLPVVPRRAGRP